MKFLEIEEENKKMAFSQIAVVEQVLRLYKIIKEEEDIHDWLKRPFPEVSDSLQKLLEDQRRLYISSDGSGFIILMACICLSDAFFFILINDSNPFIKANAVKLREQVNHLAIIEMAPYIISFFKWDLDRRKWKREADKLKFLKQTLSALDAELQGERDNLLKKYITLLMLYITDKGNDFLLATPKDVLEKFAVNTRLGMAVLNKLKNFAERGGVEEMVNEEMEQVLLDRYKPIVQRVQEGLRVFEGQYDYLLAGFVDAQFEYKDIVQRMVDSLTPEMINKLKYALQKGEVENFISMIHSIFSSVPHQLLRNTVEAYYHINLHVILKAIGCDVMSEVSTNKGRIDSVIEFDDIIYIVEYKLEESESAMKQIEEVRYYESYLTKGKRLLLLGLSFDIADKNIRKHFVLREIPT